MQGGAWEGAGRGVRGCREGRGKVQGGLDLGSGPGIGHVHVILGHAPLRGEQLGSTQVGRPLHETGVRVRVRVEVRVRVRVRVTVTVKDKVTVTVTVTVQVTVTVRLGQSLYIPLALPPPQYGYS